MNLYFNPMSAGMPTEMPATAIPVTHWNTDQQDRREELQYNQTLDGSAWRPGGYLYNEINKEAVAQMHQSGLFEVFIDPPKPVVATPAKPVKKPVSNSDRFLERLKQSNTNVVQQGSV